MCLPNVITKRIKGGQYMTLLIQNTKVKVLLLVLIALKKNNNNKNQNKTSSSSSVHEYLNIFPCASTGHLKTQTCILPGGCKSNLLLKVHNGLFMNASFPQNSMLLKVCNMKGMPSC